MKSKKPLKNDGIDKNPSDLICSLFNIPLRILTRLFRSHDMSLHVSPARVRRQAAEANVIQPPSTTASLRDTSSTNSSDSEDDGIYPPDLLTDDQILKGGFIFYAFGLFYMFCALAIVCDEFFVPALEVNHQLFFQIMRYMYSELFLTF